jgi:beta-lactamase regulating signal transducer with metallopeptidase domain
MSDLAPLQGLLIVVEAVAASVLLPPMAWLLAKAWRKSAAGRRMVWITAFAMLLALPLLALVAPSLAVIALPAPQPGLAAAPVALATPEPVRTGLSWMDLIPLAAAVWLAGLVKLGVQHVVALVRLELMRRRAMPWRMPTPIPVRGSALLVSEDCPGPMTWGVFHPVIMLPDAALDWPAERLATVLRHELAHVRRRDGLAQALAVIACALYWPNPLVWGAARALRREAELAADDAVIASGVRPSDYAGQLLELAAEWRERRLTTTGLAMAAPPALSQRVQSILSTDAIRTGATAMDTFKLVLLGGAATAALTLARPSVAEVPAPPAPPAQTLEFAQAAPDSTTQHVELRQATPAEARQKPTTMQNVEPRQAPAGDANSVQFHNQVYQFTLRHGDEQANASGDGRAEPEVRLAQQDVPAPPAVSAAPAPPAVSVQPVAPAAPAPPAPPRSGGAWTLGWMQNPNGQLPPPVVFGGRMTPEQRADLDRKLAVIGPAIDKAIADAHIDETVQKALSAQDAKTREEVAKQLQQIGPRIQQAIANAHIQELVAARMAEIQPQIEAAMAQARENSRRGLDQAAQAEERNAQRLEEQAKRARERAQRDRERLNAQPQPAQPPKN